MYINPSDLDTIQWEPTSICNANCICCPRTDHDTMLTKPWIVKFQHHTSEDQYNAVIKSFLNVIDASVCVNCVVIAFLALAVE